MKILHLTAAVIATLVLSESGLAQVKNQPGHSESAPGQKASKPGEAKKYAPGQMEKKNDKDGKPGAKEHAPGQQPNK